MPSSWEISNYLTMEICLKPRNPHALAVVIILLGVVLIPARLVDCRRERSSEEYEAISCRAHSAKLTDFGGVGDGKTSNTKAFKTAIQHLSQFAPQGGAQLIVPPGKWLTGSFCLISQFTLYLEKDAVILATQDESEWPLLPELPSYGKGKDARFSSLIFGTNLTDVVITGNNGTIDGQGAYWWYKFHKKELNASRPFLIEIMYSDRVQISNLTLLDSPNWNVHPVYCSNVLVRGLTIIAPVHSPNTDGINPDSCTNTRIEDSYIVSGDDCIAIKSGIDEYGIKVGIPTQHIIIRRIICISPYSAAIALGSEMSGGIRDVRAEDITAIDTESGIRIKTAVGRGGFVKEIFARRFIMKTMKYVFWMTGSYASHPDHGYDPKALPLITAINYRDMVAENVTYSAKLEGIQGDVFTGICISNVNFGLAKKPKKLQWNCTNVEGTSSRVTPKACQQLPEKSIVDCPFPNDKLPIESFDLKTCSIN